MTKSRMLFSALACTGVVGALAVVGVTAGPPSAPAHGAVVTRTSCAAGSTIEKDASTAGRQPVCQSLGGPETMSDTQALQAQLAARGTAGAPDGAYSSALHQMASLSSSGPSWQPVGVTPECAGSSTGSVCPAANSDNGGYSQTGSLGFRSLSGRISSFAQDPSTPGRIFASPVAGGLWESLDSGATWHSIGDALPTQVVGAIAYDAPLHELLVGTGDNSFGGDGIAGVGVLYSSDDGATWFVAGGVPGDSLTFRLVVSPADSSGDTVYAATSKGLFRSTDGGHTYVNEDLPTTPAGYLPDCAGNTTNPLCFFANIVTDVVVKTTDSTNAPKGSVMAVVGWRAGRKGDVNPDGTANTACTQSSVPTQCLQSPQNGIYLSTGSTPGAPGTFTWRSQGTLPSGGIGFAPDQVVGRTALGIAYGAGQNNDAVYALVEDAQKFNGCADFVDGLDQACNATATAEASRTVLDGMYATYDFGTSWTKVMDWSQLQQAGTNSSLLAEEGYGPGVQAWYNLWVQPDPTSTDANGNPQRVVFGLEEIWENNVPATRALPAAASPLTKPYTTQPADYWTVIGRYWNACGGVSTPLLCNPSLQNPALTGTSTTHPDQHAAMFIPDGQGGVTLFAGSDGGVYKQHVTPTGDFSNDSWGDGLNTGINSQQAYDAEMSGDGTIVSGLQDNGEMKISPDGRESEVFGGDAFYNTIDPNRSNYILEEYTYGATSVTQNGGSSWTTSSNDCSSSNALFSTPIEQDPTQAGHIVLGCGTIDEAYPNSNTPDGGYDPYYCSPDPTCNTLVTNSFTGVYTIPPTVVGGTSITNIPSAVGVRGADIYVGYCGYCDVVTQGVPFGNGIATNVGGTALPQEGTSSGWHIASAICAGCSADNKLPERYITSIQMDPSDPNTVYVTLGGYGRRWVAPGALGDATTNIGTGHVFVSHDHGEHFADITGDLPDVPADWTLIHDGQLVVATDLGVYFANDTNGGTWHVLGTSLPNVPVFTIRLAPGNRDAILASTYGRGDWLLDLSTPGTAIPEAPLAALLPLSTLTAVGVAAGVRRRRRRHPLTD